MARIKIVTDSTADIPEEVARDLGLTVVPLTVFFGTEGFLDGVELKAKEFYPKLVASPHHPKTSQPSPADFIAVYSALKNEADTIISIHLSSHLSGTCQSALLAKGMVEGVDIEVVDTRGASMSLGVTVVEAARAVRAGWSKDQVMALIERKAKEVHVFFSVDTLEYLRRNGRIGKAAALLGSLLNIKPILWLEDGVVAPYEKVRGQGRVIPRLVELIQEKMGPEKQVRVAIVHANCRDHADRLLEAIKGVFEVDEATINFIGPVIGANVGPGTLAVVFYGLGGLAPRA
ncbi:MAG TPA: DegV family protein [Bacillota bacterium]